jgi:thiol-disulfide isomerase/thioredoxin
MKDSVRGGLLVSVILVALVFYYFIWVYQPPDMASSDDDTPVASGSVNYLEETPEIPDRTPVSIGDPAPDFMFYTINNEEIRLSDYIGHKNVVLDFWATWCGPCRMEMPMLNDFYRRYSDQVEVIAITSEPKNKAREIAQFINGQEINFRVIHDASTGIQNLYPTRGIPYLVFIDTNGVAVQNHTGYDPNLASELIELFGLE